MGTGGGGVTASHRAADALGHKSQNGRAPAASRQEPADGGRSPAPPTRCKAPLGTRRRARGVRRPAPHPLIQVQASGWRCPHSPDTRHAPPCYTRSALCTPYWCKPQRATRICLVRPLKVAARTAAVEPCPAPEPATPTRIWLPKRSPTKQHRDSHLSARRGRARLPTDGPVTDSGAQCGTRKTAVAGRGPSDGFLGWACRPSWWNAWQHQLHKVAGGSEQRTLADSAKWAPYS